MKKISFMRALVADSSGNTNEEGTFMVNDGLIFVSDVAPTAAGGLPNKPLPAGLTPANQPLKSPAMAIREIIVLPDKQLRLVSKPIEKVTAEVRKLADDMFETMYDAPGIGLAAVQVAQPLRLITMDLAKRDEDGETTPRPRVFINPEILSSSEDMSVYEEGCLSIPEYYEEVERPAKVRVRFTDLDGKVHEEDADGLFATCIQHEIDHLNGVLFVDYLSKLKRDRVLKKFTKVAKRAAE
jgi:peptide deformylase